VSATPTATPATRSISIRGARQHNLCNIDLDIPRDKLVVITGLSGSGKSSLAFDTLYAEGQRRYVESLSTYARQFLEQMEKPDVDLIDGLSPAIAIGQRLAGSHPRSTVGTVTEIYDFLRLLYARVGEPFCPACNKPIQSHTVQQITDRVLDLPDGTRVQLLAPWIRAKRGDPSPALQELARQGFVRARIDGTFRELSEKLELDPSALHTVEPVVDRIVVKTGMRARVAESIETAVRLARGLIMIDIGPGEQEWFLSERNTCIDCEISLPELTPRLFSFNSQSGACPTCSGLGSYEHLDERLIISDPKRSLAQGTISCWSTDGKVPTYYKHLLASLADYFGISLDTPWCELPAPVRKAILLGTGTRKLPLRYERKGEIHEISRPWGGVLAERARRKHAAGQRTEAVLDLVRVEPCPECAGTRLRKEARSVRVGGLAIHEVCALPLDRAAAFMGTLTLPPRLAVVGERISRELRSRLAFLLDVGLDYLSLDRPSATLSGGESQRIRLATQLGSHLIGVLYILDEPSIGLHARDTRRLLHSLERLRDLGNSVIVIEHDEGTIRAADRIVELGPGAGIHGGRITAQGTLDELLDDPNSITGAYLSGRRTLPKPQSLRTPGPQRLILEGCREHNLRDVRLEIPLGCFTAVTGVSGSGKSSLIHDTLYHYLAHELHGAKPMPGAFDRAFGIEHLDKVIEVDQTPIGRTPRSNPATYTGLFDVIRQVFAQIPDARLRGYSAARFSFNKKGGRCETCQGDGVLRVEMHFLPDLFVPCEACAGRRYNRELLELRYKGRNIAEVLEMSVEDALGFLGNVPKARHPLAALCDVGLDYLQLGQPASTLSGGEAQRVKLARELARPATGRTLYILDEPTTGLHFADVATLLNVLQRLVDHGNSVVVIEHHLDVIEAADHVIDLGPEGGEKGGRIVATGSPERIAHCPESHTGRALAERMGA